MSWRFVIHPQASDQLLKLPADVDERIRTKLQKMVTNEWRDLLDCDVVRVRGCRNEVYRTRIGGYRVFFLAEESLAAIIHVDKREGAYGNTERLDTRAEDFEES